MSPTLTEIVNKFGTTNDPYVGSQELIILPTGQYLDLLNKPCNELFGFFPECIRCHGEDMYVHVGWTITPEQTESLTKYLKIHAMIYPAITVYVRGRKLRSYYIPNHKVEDIVSDIVNNLKN